LYVYCTKIRFALRPTDHIATAVSHRFAEMSQEKATKLPIAVLPVALADFFHR
jgi:hypothetical protein